jgi:hypothetical protein
MVVPNRALRTGSKNCRNVVEFEKRVRSGKAPVGLLSQEISAR